MTPNLQMEQLSLAYVRAVAAKAGFQVVRPEIDIDSVDGIIIGPSGTRPRLDFQAKSTRRADVRNSAIYFRLPVKNYNDLRVETRTPRILIVLLMPIDESLWLSQSEEELCLHNCAYWRCLEKLPPVSNVDNVTIQLPLANVLSVEQLAKLMDSVDRGASLC